MIHIQLAGSDGKALDAVALEIKAALATKGMQGEVCYAQLASDKDWESLREHFKERGDQYYITLLEKSGDA